MCFIYVEYINTEVSLHTHVHHNKKHRINIIPVESCIWDKTVCTAVRKLSDIRHVFKVILNRQINCYWDFISFHIRGKLGNGGNFAWHEYPKLEIRLHILYQHCVVKLTAYDFRLSRYIMTSMRYRYHRLKTFHGTKNPLGSHASKNIENCSRKYHQIRLYCVTFYIEGLLRITQWHYCLPIDRIVLV